MKNEPFIGRKEELKDLKRLYARNLASLIVIKGRRRIGKSRLIQEFAKGKKFIRFEGLAPTRKTTAQMQRAEFAQQLYEQLGIAGLEDVKDWGTLFSTLAKAVQDEEVVILFDEVTWMGSKDPVFLGKLKIVWDQQFKKNPNLMLILCGSLSTWIEKNIINSTGFFGRISWNITLEELSLLECSQLLRARGFKGSLQEMITILTLTGGVPWYLESIESTLSASENIRKLCFSPKAPFVEEFKYIFHDLFGKKRLPVCRKIVEALKDGPLEFDEIAQILGYVHSGSLSEYLEDLILSGFLERDHTWSMHSEKEVKASRYRLKDNYLRYYLKYIYPHISSIQKGRFKDTSPFNLPGWQSMAGLQFESLVLNNRPLIWKALGLQPEDIVCENPYFQRKTTKQDGCQIDYMIQTRFKTLYLCEVKFSRKPISVGVISEVKKKMKALKLPKGVACIPVLIHAGSVSEDVTYGRFFGNIIDFTENLKP